MYKFEIDSKKSFSNLDKQGIDFLETQGLCDDQNLINAQAESDDEIRILVIGRITEKYRSTVVTYRGGKIRIISVRQSRKSMVELYES